MAKSRLRLKARELRKTGKSVRGIAKQLNVARSTVSLWVRDIILSVEQLEELEKKLIKGRELGRFLGSLSQKRKRINLEIKEAAFGLEALGNLSEREFFIAGIALYWAEGSKTKRNVRVCNSDPEMIQLMIEWFKRHLGISTKDLKAIVGINEIHRGRESSVKKYWSKITGIPLGRFRKTSFKKSKVNKIYENFDSHYGTLTIEVLKSARFYYRIMGLIKALSRQGSSMAERRFHKARVVGSTPTPVT